MYGEIIVFTFSGTKMNKEIKKLKKRCFETRAGIALSDCQTLHL
jgi:hypothetical protein